MPETTTPTGRALDAAIAELLEPTWERRIWLGDVEWRPFISGKSCAWSPVPRCHESPTAARFLESELERRGLDFKYVLELWRIVGGGGCSVREQGYFKLAHASPADRAAAAWRVLEAAKGQQDRSKHGT